MTIKQKIKGWRLRRVPKELRRRLALLLLLGEKFAPDDAALLRMLGGRPVVDHARHDAECEVCRVRPTILCMMQGVYDLVHLELPNGKQLKLRLSWGGIDSCES